MTTVVRPLVALLLAREATAFGLGLRVGTERRFGVRRASPTMSVTSTTRRVRVEQGVELKCLEYGKPSTDKVVLLLHGFPDCSLSWVRQAPILASSGFFVVCPDMRGYGGSSKPPGVASYSREKLCGDVDALRRHYCGDDGAFLLLAGHDWGAAVVWACLEGAAAESKCLTKRAAILNVPHPVTFARGLFTPQQLPKSWYIVAFQIPMVAESLLSAGDGAVVRRVLGAELKEGGASKSRESLLESYGRAAATPGAMQSAVNYYRASGAGLWGGFLPSSFPSPFVDALRLLHGVEGRTRTSTASSSSTLDRAGSSAVIDVPVLVLWGKNDPYLGIELATPPPDLVPRLTGPVIFSDAGHWVHWEKAEDINRELLGFLGGA